MCFFWTPQSIHRCSRQKPGMFVIKAFPYVTGALVLIDYSDYMIMAIFSLSSFKEKTVFCLIPKLQETFHSWNGMCYNKCVITLSLGSSVQGTQQRIIENNTCFHVGNALFFLGVLLFNWSMIFFFFHRLSQTAKTQSKVLRGFMAGRSQIPMCSASKTVWFTTLYRCPQEQPASRWEKPENHSDNWIWQCLFIWAV